MANNSFNTYRLTDDVQGEILKALQLWTNSSLMKNELLVERAFQDLQNPYSTVEFNYNTAEPPVGVQTILSKEKQLKATNFENLLTSLGSDINYALQNATPENYQKLLANLKATYDEVMQLKS